MSQLSLFGNEESEKSRSCQVGFPVSRTALPGSVELLLMSVISGENLPGSFAKLGPNGCWLKTCQGYCQASLDGSLEEFSETWPRWGILRGGACMALTPLVRPTDEIGCSLWRTPQVHNALQGPKSKEFYEHCLRTGQSYITLTDQVRHTPAMWPTPSVCGNYNRKGASKNSGDGLATAVRMWPTPTTNCHQNPGEHGQGGQNLVTEVYKRDAGAIPTTGQLNPMWVSVLMGFPPHWTEVD